MTQILNGKIIQNQIINRLKKEVEGFALKPTLAIIQIGDIRESFIYIQHKKIFAQKIGANVMHLKFDTGVSKEKLVEKIKQLNNDDKIHGIIIQLPIPKHLNEHEIIEAIDPSKDVDGLTSTNFKLLASGSSGGFMNATTKGVINLLDYYNINIVGQHALVIGRSMLVGKSIALALLNRDATVTIAHTKTVNIKQLARASDILIVAVGRPLFINDQYIHPGHIVIDIGTNFENPKSKEKSSDKDQKQILTGDVDFEKVKEIVGAISPVPGGVGPMTVASLFENLIMAYKKVIKVL